MSESKPADLSARLSDVSRMFGGRRRRRAAEELAALGTPEAMAVLADAFVHAADPVVGEIARGALQSVREQGAVDAVADVVVATGDEGLACLLAKVGAAPSDPGWYAVVLFLAGEFERYADLDFDGGLLRGVRAGAGEVLRRRLAETARAGGRLEWVRAVAGGAGRVSEIEWDAAVQTLTAARRWEELWRLALDATAERAAPLMVAVGEVGWRPDGDERPEFAELVRLARRAQAEELPGMRRFGEREVESLPTGLAVQAMTMTSDGDMVIAGNDNKDSKLWSVPSGQPVGDVTGAAVLTMATTSDGKFLVTGDLAGGIKVWNFPSLRPAGQYARTTSIRNALLGSNLLAVAISPDGTLMASGGYGTHVRLWRLSSGRLTPTTTFRADMLWVPCLAITPDGSTLISGGQKGNLRLWSLPDGAPIRSFKGHTDHVGALAITPDGSLLASGGYDGTVRLWRLPSGEPAGVLAAQTEYVRALAMTPDGKLLAAGGKDGVVRLWDLPSGDPAGELPGHQGVVECLAVSSDGSVLASGSTSTASRGGQALWWTREESKLSTLVRTPLGKVDPGEIHRLAQSSGGFSDSERAWFLLVGAVVRWRHRHDVELLDPAHGDQGAAHDVELTDDER